MSKLVISPNRREKHPNFHKWGPARDLGSWWGSDEPFLGLARMG